MAKLLFNKKVILVEILVLIFGINAWLLFNGTWVETPLLIQALPEGWRLNSYIAIMTRLGDILGIMYAVIKIKFLLKYPGTLSIHILIFVAAMASVLLSLFWDHITEINGSKYSVIFLVLSTITSVFAGFNMIIFLPFMTNFKPKYVIIYLTGLNLGVSIPSIIGLAQGVGGKPICVNSTLYPHKMVTEYSEPRFSVNVYYIIILIITLISWLSFTLLTNLKWCQSERVSIGGIESNSIELEEHKQHYKSVSTGRETDFSKVNDIMSERQLNTEVTVENISRQTYLVLLFTEGYICFLWFGILLSLQSYSCLPYGRDVLHITVNLCGVFCTVACFVVSWFSLLVLKRSLTFVIFIVNVCAIYIIWIAVMSPNPPLKDSVLGNVLIVGTWVIFVALSCYTRTAIASILRHTSTGHKSLFYYGVYTQIGSTFGAIIIFLFINYTDIFVSSPTCA